MSDCLAEIASLRESLAATQSALAEAIADARSMMEERDEARAQGKASATQYLQGFGIVDTNEGGTK